ncbi:TPA: gamma-glutamyltransferase [Candidatus Poribacteria bacterium]|nr:gamma-glutamyltransferase [Candidatus Poribacteria bacterium]HIO66698.1 gamma-glutamyltransferase [Flavobacteriales bacterium]
MAFPSHGITHRSTVTGTRGMVTSAHPIASLAGVRILLQGGNAFDAAVAVASTLNVVEPYMSGLAGCGYMLVYSAKEQRIRVLDYMGTSPYQATLEAYSEPRSNESGIRSGMVPGACGGWISLLNEYGSMSLSDVFSPAIEYAEKGYAVTVKNAFFMDGASSEFSNNWSNITMASKVMMFRGRTPLPGEVLIQKDLAKTFRQVVSGGMDTFYHGEIAQEIAQFSRQNGGLITEKDLEDFQVEWHNPISIPYKGYEIYCPPPPCSGFQYLETLNILETDSLADLGHNSVDYLHLLIESIKLASADRAEYTCRQDPKIAGLLSKGYASNQRQRIKPEAGIGGGERHTNDKLAREILPGAPSQWINECTTHFDVVDNQGNAVATTQSLGSGFGSGVVLGNTGMFLNNLMSWFDLLPESPNVVAPHKKIEMCMSPCQIWKDNNLFAVLGTPGGHGILQTTPQMILNLIEHGMNIQAAIEASRVRIEHPGTDVGVEERISSHVREELAARGHEVRVLPAWTAAVGGGQGIAIDPEEGSFMGGADPRRDGYAIGI